MSVSNLRRLLSACLFEATLSWHFIRKDLSTTIIPGSIFMVVASFSHSIEDARIAPVSFAFGFVYFWLYIYSFCIANQLTGIEEDRINKPYRPLPSGLVSISGARIRWAIVSLLFCVTGACLGVARWAVLWVAVTIALTFVGLARLWWFKNPVAMSLGTIAQLAAAWEIVTPSSPNSWRWILATSVWAGLTVSIQDFRDTAGDRANHRRTLPVILGDTRARWIVALAWTPMPVLVHYALFGIAHPTPLVMVCDALLAICHAIIIIRLLTLRTPKQDHTTYIAYTYLYCLVLLNGLVVL